MVVSLSGGLRSRPSSLSRSTLPRSPTALSTRSPSSSVRTTPRSWSMLFVVPILIVEVVDPGLGASGRAGTRAHGVRIRPADCSPAGRVLQDLAVQVVVEPDRLEHLSRGQLDALVAPARHMTTWLGFSLASSALNTTSGFQPLPVAIADFGIEHLADVHVVGHHDRVRAAAGRDPRTGSSSHSTLPQAHVAAHRAQLDAPPGQVVGDHLTWRRCRSGPWRRDRSAGSSWSRRAGRPCMLTSSSGS